MNRIFPNGRQRPAEVMEYPSQGGSAKNPGREFLMDCEKDKIGKFERGYLESNHRKVSGFGLSQDAKRPIMTFGTAASQGFF